MMELTRDSEYGLSYIKLSDNEVYKTEEFNSEVFIDLDVDNRVVGVEILNPRNIPYITSQTWTYDADYLQFEFLLNCLAQLEAEKQLII